MVKITITVEDETLDFKASKVCLSFESAGEALGKVESAYQRRQVMELQSNDF